MTRIYWMELRRSPLRWLLPLFIVIDLASVFGRQLWWIGVWPQASAAAQIPSLFFGPAFAAGAAMAASRAYRSGFDEQLRATALHRWKPEFAQFSATVTYGVLPYGLGVILAAVVSIPDAGAGFMWPGYLMLGLINVIGCAAVGHAAGRRSRSTILTPLCCGLGLFVVLGMLGQALGLFVLSGHPQVVVSASAITARAAGALAVVGLALLITSSRRRNSAMGWPMGRLRRIALIGGFSLLAAASFSAVTGDPLLVERRAPESPLCEDGPARVCVWPEDRKYLPQISAMADNLSRLPPDIVQLPADYMEIGLRPQTGQQGDFQILEGSMWSISPAFASAALQGVLPEYCRAADESAEERRALAVFQLQSWLEARANGSGQPNDVHGGPPGVDLKEIGRLITQPDVVQFQWARRQLKIVRETPCG